MEFAVHAVTSGSTTTLRVSGEVDLETGGELASAGLAAFDEGAAVVVVDLSEVTFLDSTGLYTLLTLNNRARADGARLALHDPSPRVARVLQISGLDQIFTVVGTSTARGEPGSG